MKLYIYTKQKPFLKNKNNLTGQSEIVLRTNMSSS